MEGLEKIGVAGVAQRFLDLSHGITVPQHGLSRGNFLQCDVPIDCSVGMLLGKIGIENPFEKHMEEFKRAVEIAHKMDTKNIRMFSFYVPEGKGAQYKEQVFDRLGQFVDYAKANDAVLLHENEKGIYGEMAAECRELMDAFYGDHFKAIFGFRV